MEKSQHIPVLLDEVLKYLDPKNGESFLDLTAGYGGHAGEILKRSLDGSKAVLVDRDQNSIVTLRDKFGSKVSQIIHKDFLKAAKDLRVENRQFDIILADLGVSSPHLNMASRGFSISQDGPLDMRMDQRQAVTADGIVNNYNEAKLTDLIRRYGEESRAHKVARSIVEHRPVKSTKQLAEIVTRASSRGWSKIHPATRTFQALRIAVNDELDLLASSLPIWIDDLLTPGGRIVVISFHSLEDRIVKQAFQDRSRGEYEATLRLLTKSPVTGSSDELVFNPRARSAKLRAAVKINKPK